MGARVKETIFKPETRNPKPETRNPKPETRNPKLTFYLINPRTRHNRALSGEAGSFFKIIRFNNCIASNRIWTKR